MKLLTVKEVARELGIAEVTVRLWLAQRRFKHVKLGRAIRIPASEIARVVEQGTVPASTGRRS